MRATIPGTATGTKTQTKGNQTQAMATGTIGHRWRSGATKWMVKWPPDTKTPAPTTPTMIRTSLAGMTARISAWAMARMSSPSATPGWNSLGTGDAIQGALRRLNKKYRNHAVQGVMMLSASLFGAAIPTQFDDAVLRNKDIKTVIMTGGGNDIIQTAGLQDDCKKGGDACKEKLAEIADAMKKLWAKMATAGVQDLVYIGYSKDAGSSGEAASDPAMNGIKKVCDEATLFCHIIDSTPLVNKQLILDGIHPTQAANDRMANAILTLMEQRKVRR